MKDLTNSFGTLYHPQKAILIYQQDGGKANPYVESYDFDAQGSPINAHPLSMAECKALAKALLVNEKQPTAFLRSAGLLPKNVLYINPENSGYAVWHTPKQSVKLLFRDDLGIPCGKANLPAMVWKASKQELAVYALAGDCPVDGETILCHAPFFNIYREGRVCMGNVNLKIPATCGLEQFITLWQDAFFNSYFSHMLEGHNPIKGNLVQLWKNLTNTKKKFPEKCLQPTNYKIKNLIK